MNNDYFEREEACRLRFEEAPPCWHLCTPEDFHILFTDENDFRAIMAIIGICAVLCPDIRIYTFQVMSNHLHIILGGQEDRINLFWGNLKRFLSGYNKTVGKTVDLSGWNKKLLPINNLGYMRAAIAYCNRNAYVVYPNYSQYNYPWGANKFFFNDEAKDYHKAALKKMSVRAKRAIIKSKCADNVAGPYLVDGCVSPISFCDIEGAERFFRDTRNYISMISKDIESQKNIAHEIGEGIFYTDDELYKAIAFECREKYRGKDIVELSSDEKITMAVLMHREYNAGNKQIGRILRLDISIVDQLFPMKSKKGLSR